jgi:hypothetical protein
VSDIDRLDTARLCEGDRFRVTTLNTTYDITMIDPSTGTVTIEGGHSFPFAMQVVLFAPIAVGIELHVHRPGYKPLRTTPIQSIEFAARASAAAGGPHA